MFTMLNHGLNLLQWTNILDFFHLSYCHSINTNFIKKIFFTQKLFNYQGTFYNALSYGNVKKDLHISGPF